MLCGQRRTHIYRNRLHYFPWICWQYYSAGNKIKIAFISNTFVWSWAICWKKWRNRAISHWITHFLLLTGFGDCFCMVSETFLQGSWLLGLPSLLTQSRTHHLHHLAVEPQLHDIHVDGGEDGDYGTVLYLNFHPEKYFGFKCFPQITLYVPGVQKLQSCRKFSSLVFLQYFIPEWNLVLNVWFAPQFKN